MSDKPTLHMIGIFHTIHSSAFSHCAFTGKALRFSKMMKPFGYKVVEYANAGSESEADEKVEMMDTATFQKFYGGRKETDFFGDVAIIGSPGHKEFEKHLLPALKERVGPRDIICHPFGESHDSVVKEFPRNFHVETGIGYPNLMRDSFKIFESYAWLHYHLGKEKRQGSHYDFVIPNYFDLADWEPKYEHGDYIAFLGRIGTSKGLDTIYEIAKRIDMKIILHGQGDPLPWSHPNVEYRGPISGRARSEFLRNAYCAIMPTTFVEPFGGSGVEAMLCGTPLVAVDYGAFTETVQIGVTGFRCKVLKQWLGAIQSVRKLDRKIVAEVTRRKYSLETCGAMYDSAFRQIDDLNEYGWYTLAIQKQDKQLAVRAPMAPIAQDIRIPVTVTEPAKQAPIKTTIAEPNKLTAPSISLSSPDQAISDAVRPLSAAK